MLISLLIIGALLHVNGQVNQADEHSRSSKSSSLFDAQFHRGQCPTYFYQLANECLHFSNAPPIYSWQQAEKWCMKQVMPLAGQSSSQIRPLILNTPDKTRILEAFYRNFDELHYLVRLPPDFHALQRCRDGMDDYLPLHCGSFDLANGSCFSSGEFGSERICLQQIDCQNSSFRLACEFTIEGQCMTR
jgi:hypothetical protein